MKKKIIIALLAAFGFAQTQAQATFKPGFRAGANFANITESQSKYKTDFYFGGLLEMNLTKRYTLQPEVSYSRQGAKGVLAYTYDNNGNEIQSRGDVNINYLSITAMNKFNIVQGFYVMVGPSLDIVLSDNLETGNYGSEEPIDVAINAGFGYSAPSGIGFEFRFKKGLADVLDNDYYEGGDGFFFGDYNTNILFQVGLTYTFKTK